MSTVPPLRALVLAAGLCTRMGARPRHKCTEVVGDRPILARTIQALAAAGIRDVDLVVGHLEADVVGCARAAAAGVRVAAVRNDRYASTGTAASLALGLAAAGEAAVLVVEADVVFDEAALERLLDAGSADATLVAPFGPGVSGSGVVFGEDRIVRDWFHGHDPVAPATLQAAWKTVNLTRLTARTAARLRDLCAAAAPGAPLEHALRRLVGTGAAIEAVDVAGAPWWEVDTVEDLGRARSLFAAPAAGGR